MCGDTEKQSKKIFVTSPDEKTSICQACVNLCAVLIREGQAMNSGEYGSWL